MAENLCRICLQHCDNTLSIVQKRSGLSPLEKLFKCKIKINIFNHQTSRICFQCNSELDIVLSFLKKCAKSNDVPLLSTKYSARTVDREPFVNNIIYEDDLSNNDSQILERPEHIEGMNNKSTLTAPNVPTVEAPCKECGFKNCRLHHTCQYCRKVFNRKFNLTLHMRRHNMGFKWESDLRRARSRRVCPISGCGKTFTTGTNLNTHLTTHTGERPHKCAECGKTFTSKNTLSVHLKIHTGVKPYLCPICGARFTTNKLSSHLRTHTNDKPYQCEVLGCKKAFRSPRSLRLHGAAHSPAAPQGCALCPAAYKHTQSLRKHVRRQHGDTTQACTSDTQT